MRGKILFSTSTGCLKVKGKKRISTHILRLILKLMLKGIFESRIRHFIIYFTNIAPKKQQQLFFKTLGKVKAFSFKSLHFLSVSSHNGCRPSKVRRK